MSLREVVQLASGETERQLEVFDEARSALAQGARGFIVIIQDRDGNWSHWRVHDRRYELVGVLQGAAKSILEE